MRRARAIFLRPSQDRGGAHRAAGQRANQFCFRLSHRRLDPPRAPPGNHRERPARRPGCKRLRHDTGRVSAALDPSLCAQSGEISSGPTISRAYAKARDCRGTRAAWAGPSIGEFGTNRCTSVRPWTSSSMRGSSKRRARFHASRCPEQRDELGAPMLQMDWRKTAARQAHASRRLAARASVLAVHVSSHHEPLRLVGRSGQGRSDREDHGHPPSGWNGAHGRRPAHVGRQSGSRLPCGSEYLRRERGRVSLFRQRQPHAHNHADGLSGGRKRDGRSVGGADRLPKTPSRQGGARPAGGAVELRIIRACSRASPRDLRSRSSAPSARPTRRREWESGPSRPSA